jgi:adhesin/invasin
MVLLGAIFPLMFYGCESVTVNVPDIASITVSPPDSSVFVGQTLSLTATPRSASGLALAERAINWTSSSTSTATVDASGSVVAQAPGSVEITASSEGVSGSALITVMARPVIELSRSEVTFRVQSGAGTPQPATVEVSNAASGNLTGLQVSVSYEPGGATGWLSATLGSGNAPSSLTLQVQPGVYPSGIHRAEVTVSAQEAENSPRVIEVMLEVEDSPPEISLERTLVNFSGQEGQGAPSPQSVSVSNSGGGVLSGLTIQSIQYQGQAQGWLSASLSGSTAPAAITLVVNPEGLAPDATYTANVVVAATSVPGSTATIQVRLAWGDPPPEIALSRSQVAIVAMEASPPLSETLVQVENAGGGDLTGLEAEVIFSQAQPSGWLEATLSSSSAPGNLELWPDPTGLAPGEYVADVEVSSPVAVNSPQGVLVQFSVMPRPSGAFSLIVADPDTIPADGASTSTITVSLRDLRDDPILQGGHDVSLETTLGSIGTVNDNGDGTFSATLTSTTTAGTATITGTVNGDPIADQATVEFVSGGASPLTSTISADPATITVDPDAVEVPTSSTITVQLFDENSNPVTTGGHTIVLSSGIGTLSSPLDNQDGTYTATLTSTQSGTATITGTLGGVDMVSEATVEIEPGPPSAAHTTISASPTTVEADGSSASTITVQLRDQFGNPVTAVTQGEFVVVLSATEGTLDSFSDNADGTYTALLRSGSTGPAVVTGTLDGEGIGDDATVQFVTGAPSASNSMISASPTSIVADGSSTSTITVQVFDSNNNPLATGGDDVALVTNLGSLGTVSDNGDGSYSATLTAGTSPGTATITGTLNGAAIGDDASVAFTAAPVSAANTTITASPTSIVADGSSTSTITVQVFNTNNDPVTSGGDDVALVTNLGSLGTVTDNGDGTYSATLTAGTTPGTATVTGTLNGAAIGDDATVQFTAVPVSADNTTISASPTSIVANGSSTSTITVQVFDTNNNPVTSGGDAVTLTTTLGSLGTVSDNGDGSYSATLTAGTSPGTATITGTLNGAAIGDDASVAFTAAPVSAANTTITASPTSIVADGSSTSTITVQVFNTNNDPVTSGGDDVALVTNLGSLGTVSDNGDGSYSATLTAGTSPGTATITGTLNGAAIGDDATVQFTAVPVSAANTTISASPTSIVANGSSTSTITVQVFDTNNNPVTSGGDAVTLTTTLGSLGTVSDNGDGSYSATLTAGTSPGTATITGTLNGAAIGDDASVAFTAAPVSAANTTITASPTSIVADGSSTSTITVQVFNTNNDPVTSGGDDVALVTNLGSLGTVSDNGDGSYSATLTAGTSPGTATITGTLNGAAIGDDATVQFTAVPVSAANTTISASPTSIVANGSSTSTITVQVFDTNNNPVTSGGDAVTLTTTLGSLGTVSDNGDGSYSATLTAGTSPGTATVTGTLNGAAIGDDATVQFEPGPPAAITLTGPSQAETGVATTLTLTVVDQFGNSTTVSADRQFTLSVEPAGNASFDPPSPITVTAGTSVAAFTYTQSEPGSRTITANGTLADDLLVSDTHEISVTDAP